MVHLLGQPGLHRIEQVAIDNGRLPALEDFPLERYLSDIEPVAQQMSERPAGERNAAHSLPGLEHAHFADDAALAQVSHQQAETAEFEVAAEDGSDRFGLPLID